jgi:hypothetical protein
MAAEAVNTKAFRDAGLESRKKFVMTNPLSGECGGTLAQPDGVSNAQSRAKS